MLDEAACTHSRAHRLQERTQLFAKAQQQEVRIKELEQELQAARDQLADLSRLRCGPRKLTHTQACYHHSRELTTRVRSPACACSWQ
jgi:hypothetical protein